MPWWGRGQCAPCDWPFVEGDDERRVVECIQAEVDQMGGGLQCRVYAKDPLHPNLVVSLCRTGPKEEEEAAGRREVDDLDNLDQGKRSGDATYYLLRP